MANGSENMTGYLARSIFTDTNRDISCVKINVKCKLMKTMLLLLLLVGITQLKAQNIDKDYIVKWIKMADTTFDVDAVVKYSINRESFYTTDTLKLNNRLRQISTDKLKAVFFSKFKTDNYVPGKGTIYVQSIQQLATEDVKIWLDNAKKLFVDQYASFSNHIHSNSKDPVLVIDNRHIHHTEVKISLEKLNPGDIYDISVGQTPVPALMYGQNAKNGLVQIWTKKFMTK